MTRLAIRKNLFWGCDRTEVCVKFLVCILFAFAAVDAAVVIVDVVIGVALLFIVIVADDADRLMDFWSIVCSLAPLRMIRKI